MYTRRCVPGMANLAQRASGRYAQHAEPIRHLHRHIFMTSRQPYNARLNARPAGDDATAWNYRALRLNMGVEQVQAARLVLGVLTWAAVPRCLR